MRLTAAAVPYGVSVRQTLDFAFLVETDEGIMDIMTPYEFACYSVRCIPQNGGGSEPKGGGKGGGGGAEGAPAKPKKMTKAEKEAAAAEAAKVGVGSGALDDKIGLSEQHPDHPSTTRFRAKPDAVGSGADDDRDMARIRATAEGATVRADGILAEPWLDDQGNVVLTGAQEAALAGKLKAMGTSEAEWVENFVGVALRASNGDAEAAAAAAAARVWYQNENQNWGQPLADRSGMSVEQVMGIATATSTNATWDTHNKPVTERIIKMVTEDQEFTITREAADAYNAFSSDKPGSGGSWGARTIEPGTYKASELSTGTLARVAGKDYGIGGQYFTVGLVKAFAIARGEATPNQAFPSLKQRSFFNNLARPMVDYSSTNDFWMTRAAFGSKVLSFDEKKAKGDMTIKQYEAVAKQQANSIIGSDGVGNSAMFAGMTRATKTAMKRLADSDPRFQGIRTNEMQALVWIQAQKEYGDVPGGIPS